MKIAIVSFNYSFLLGSMTSSLPMLLAKHGHTVALYTDRDTYNYGPKDTNPSMTIHISDIVLNQRMLQDCEKFDKFLIHMPLALQCRIASSAYSHAGWLQSSLKNFRPDIILAVEVNSLVSLYWCTVIPIIYINMELLGWEQDKWIFPHKYLIKNIEIEMLKRIERVYITSSLRGNIFSEINNYPREKIKEIPVVPMGMEQARSNNFFRKKFNIPINVRIVLHAGHIAPWTLCHQIIPTVFDWPQNTALILHTWDKKLVPKDYLEYLYSLAKNLPIYFSFEDVAMNEKCNTWASADIGLAFYQKIDNNFTEILFSSNKFGEYMKAGLPVICSEHESLYEFVAKEKIGRAISPDKCAESVYDIINNYEFYKNNVSATHQKYFILEKYIDEINNDMIYLSNLYNKYM